MELVEFEQGTVPEATALWVELPCQPQHNLDWQREVALAVSANKKILWYFNLGLEDPFFPIEDELRFASLSLALKQFTTLLWPQVQAITLGLALYRGPAVDFAMYFQMLAHKLPDETPIWLLFEVEPQWTPSAVLQKISQEGFEHFRVALKGVKFPQNGYHWDEAQLNELRIETTTGLVFPRNATKAAQFDEMAALKPGGRVVLETALAEQWDELDRLLVLKDSLTPQGTRLLQGFVAAGGEVVYYDL